MRSYLLLTAIATAASALTCYDGVRVFIARGTGEPQNSSVTNLMGRAILASIPNSYSTEVTYPANFDATSVGVGVADSQNQIYNYVRACPDSQVVLLGYSQGARVIGNAIAGGNAPASPVAQPLCSEISQNIVAVALFGDPGRQLGVGVESDTNGPACEVSAGNPRNGTALAAIETYEDRLAEWCAAGDPVCCASGNEYSAHLSYWTNENAEAVASYVASQASSATVTSATLASSCTAVRPPSTSSTVSSVSARPSGTAASSGSRLPVSGVASGTGSVPSIATRSPTLSAPLTPMTARPTIATQTANAAMRIQAGFVGGAAVMLAGAAML